MMSAKGDETKTNTFLSKPHEVPDDIMENKRYFTFNLPEYKLDNKRIHTFQPDLNEKSLYIAQKKKNIYSNDNHDNVRDPVHKLRPVDMRE